MDQEASSSSSASTSQPSILLIVYDNTHYPSPPKNTKLEVSPTLTGQQLIEKIAEVLDYPQDAFEIKLRNVYIEVGEGKTLEELGAGVKSIVTISRKSGAKEEDFKVKKSPDYHIPNTTTTSTAIVPIGPVNSPSYGNSNYSSGYSPYSSNWSHPTKTAGRGTSGFVGLSNQGATCYMNSLIQTLYMTPEFRLAVYKWSFEEKYKKSKEEKEQNGKGSNDSQAASSSSNSDRVEKEKMSIPLQLQRLFAKLQLADLQTTKTKDLTKSFGWEDADAFTQHDVQELCRVLFDALEKNFKGTEQANMVNELYQGKMKDYVQCKECHNESARTDDYLDIPLVIQGFGEATAVSSVEEALRKFVTPETLDKDNQYNCEKCGKKVDAVKGLKFVSFPYLLSLQLKRFDFDYSNMRRIKLNDRVTFPHYLDLNALIFGDNNDNNDNNANNNNNNNLPVQVSSDPDEIVEEDAGAEDSTEDFSDDELVPNGEHKRLKNGHNGAAHHDNVENFDFEGPPPVLPTPERPYIYELYSVLIHRGSTMGGHYYAYIKAFDSKKWFEFNDSTVSEISPNEIKKAFGGDDDPPYPGYTSMYKSTYKSTANAYMLMYRKVDPAKNLTTVAEADVPQSARDMIENEKQQIKDKRDSAEREREMVKFKIFYPAGSASKDVGKELSIHKSVTFEEATKQAAEAFGLSEKWAAMGISGVRLRGYQSHNELPTTTYAGQEQKTLEELHMFGGSMYSPKNMMLETREPQDEPFVDYNMSDILFRVAKFDTQSSSFSSFINIYVPKSGTISTLKHAVEARLDIPVDRQRIFKEAYVGWSNSSPVELVDLSQEYPLKGPKISEPEKYYIEYLLLVVQKTILD